MDSMPWMASCVLGDAGGWLQHREENRQNGSNAAGGNAHRCRRPDNVRFNPNRAAREPSFGEQRLAHGHLRAEVRD